MVIGDHHTIVVRAPGAVPLWLVITGRLPIGRAGEGLLVDDDRVSRYHCAIEVDDEGLAVRDGGSSHGTSVNGQRITGRTGLRTGDVIAIGDTTIVVDPDPATLVGPPRPGATAAAPATSAPAQPQVPPTDPSAGPSTPGSAAEVAATLSASVVGGSLTIVFSDIVDSTALTERHGDLAWYAILRRHNRLVRHHLATRGGREVKGQGDGFMLTFPSSRHGALFAVDLQRALAAARAEDPAFPVHVRVGVHTGEVIEDSGDIFGWHVNMAARVTGQGGADEIVVSALVHDVVARDGDLRFTPPRTVALKGLDGSHLVHPLQWR